MACSKKGCCIQKDVPDKDVAAQQIQNDDQQQTSQIDDQQTSQIDDQQTSQIDDQQQKSQIDDQQEESQIDDHQEESQIDDHKQESEINDHKRASQISATRFWALLGNDGNLAVPLHIQNILCLVGLDNPVAFKSITDTLIEEVENFARTKMIKLIKEPRKMEDYYGAFKECPSDFEFMIGERLLIKELVGFVKKRDSSYWNTVPFNGEGNNEQQENG